MCVFVCVCVCAFRIVSLDKFLRCRNTLIIIVYRLRSCDHVIIIVYRLHYCDHVIIIVYRLRYCDHDYDAVSDPLLLQGGETSQGEVEERDVCDMQVYDDPLFMLRVSRFPYTTSSATGIYIQALAPNSTYHLFPMIRPYWYASSFSQDQAIPVCTIFFP